MTSQKPIAKRIKIESLGRGSGTLYQRTKDGAYEHIYWDPQARRQVTQTLKAATKTAARKEAQGRVGKIDKGEMIAPSMMTFDDLAEQAFASFESMVKTGERSAQSLHDFRRRYRVHIKPRVGHLRAQTITRARALSLLSDLRSGDSSPATVAAAWRTFVWIVNHGRDVGVLDIDTRLPKGKRIQVENVRPVRVLTKGEADRVIAATPKRWRLLVETAYLTGARVSELLGLRFTDCDLAAGTVTISAQLDREGHRSKPKSRNGVRTISISDHLRRELLAAYNVAEDKTGWIFGADTEPVGRYRLAARALAKGIEDSGIDYNPATERVSFHSFRHAVASNLIRQGIDPQRVAEHLGDTIETVLRCYVHSVTTDADVNLGELLIAV